MLNIKTAESIGPKCCVGPHITPWKIYGTSKLEDKKSWRIVGISFFLKMCQLEKRNPPKSEIDLKCRLS